MIEPEEDGLADGDEPLEALLVRDPGELAATEAPEAAERNRALLALYLEEISRISLLSHPEEIELARRVQRGDAEAERRLVEANLRLVVRIARRYLGRGLSLLDLIEEGNLGLLHAARKFQADRGTRFSTYATWWIRQAVARALANQARMIRLPVHVELLLGQYVKARNSLTQDLGRAPSLAEVARAMGRPEEEIEQLEALRQQPVSLDAPVGPDLRRRIEDLVPDAGPLPGAGLAAVLHAGTDIGTLLENLPETERTVLTLRFGLEGAEPMTLERIGWRLGVTRERVRQIEAAALQRLQKLLAARGIDRGDVL